MGTIASRLRGAAPPRPIPEGACAARRSAHPPTLGFSFLFGGFAPTPPPGAPGRCRGPAGSAAGTQPRGRTRVSCGGCAPTPPLGSAAGTQARGQSRVFMWGLRPHAPTRIARPHVAVESPSGPLSPLGEGGGEGRSFPCGGCAPTPPPGRCALPPAPSPLAGEGGGEGERAQPATGQAPAGEPRSPPGTSPRLATQPRGAPSGSSRGGVGGAPP